MSIDKDLSDRPIEGRSPGDSFGKEAVPADLRKALAEPASSVELDEERAEALPEGANPLPNRRNGSSPKTATTDSGKVLWSVRAWHDGPPDPGPDRGDPWYRSLPGPDLRNRRGDGRGDGLAKPTAGAMLSDRLHGRDPGRYSQVSNTAGFSDLAILPDGTGDVLGLRFRANEGATVRAKGLNALRNRGVQDIPIAAVNAEAAEATPVEVEVEDRDLGADLEAPPGGSDPGHFPSEEAAAKSIYIEQTSTSREWTRPVRQWHAVKSQRAIMFEDRFPMASSKRQHTEFRTVSAQAAAIFRAPTCHDRSRCGNQDRRQKSLSGRFSIGS